MKYEVYCVLFTVHQFPWRSGNVLFFCSYYPQASQVYCDITHHVPPALALNQTVKMFPARCLPFWDKSALCPLMLTLLLSTRCLSFLDPFCVCISLNALVFSNNWLHAWPMCFLNRKHRSDLFLLFDQPWFFHLFYENVVVKVVW